MHDYVSREISNLADEFSRKLSGKRIDTYVDAVKRFDPEVLRQTCRKFAKQAKGMPTPDELEQACSSLVSHFENQYVPGTPAFVGACQYRDLEESRISRSMCKKTTATDITDSKAQGWPPLCPWHYQVMSAKAFPKSSTIQLVEALLKAPSQPDAKPREGWADKVFKKPAA